MKLTFEVTVVRGIDEISHGIRVLDCVADRVLPPSYLFTTHTVRDTDRNFRVVPRHPVPLRLGLVRTVKH